MSAIPVPPSPIVLSTRGKFRETLLGRVVRSPRIIFGAIPLLVIALSCFISLPWVARSSLGVYTEGINEGYDIPNPNYFNEQNLNRARLSPRYAVPIPEGETSPGVDLDGKPLPTHDWRLLFGTDNLGRSILIRCLFGGTISLAVGLAAAGISIVLGVTVGLIAGYAGGWIDSTLMRIVDVMYGLPYVLMIILFKVALETPLTTILRSGPQAKLVVLFLAIGLVSWLTMARVVRGQVLSLRAQPYIEAARAMGLPKWRIFFFHLLPNLVGPIIVYGTLTIPQAILQESFLSFLGIGVGDPMSTWGSLAADGRMEALNPSDPKYWYLLFPCLLLAITLLCLNFVGDGLRDVLDPKREAAKI